MTADAARITTPAALAGVALIVAFATIVAALGFEHLGGYEPCALCLKERIPYYVGVPVIAAGLAALALRLPRPAPLALFLVFAGIMAWGAGLGVYHAGAEWAFWAGPATCGDTGGGPASADALSDLLKAPTIGPSCTEATWRLLGLSFAGWNAVIATGLACLGLLGAARVWRAAA